MTTSLPNVAFEPFVMRGQRCPADACDYFAPAGAGRALRAAAQCGRYAAAGEA
jgi:hypothetical protein